LTVRFGRKTVIAGQVLQAVESPTPRAHCAVCSYAPLAPGGPRRARSPTTISPTQSQREVTERRPPTIDKRTKRSSVESQRRHSWYATRIGQAALWTAHHGTGRTMPLPSGVERPTQVRNARPRERRPGLPWPRLGGGR
jgi:hypothetical protein